VSKLTSYEQKIRAENFTKGLLWCNCCKQFLPIDKFYKCNAETSNYGCRFYCKRCEYDKKDKRRVNEYWSERNRRLKEKYVELAGGCCQRCGYNKYQSALSFHHVYPEDKDCHPNKALYSGDPEKAWKELDKCCLLCMNCHRSYEATDWRAEFIKRNGLGWTIGKDLPLEDNRYHVKPQTIEATPIPSSYKNGKIKQLLLFT
jgi:hypothetical protein